MRFGPALVLLLSFALAGQDTAPERKPEKAAKEERNGVRFVWKRHPSIRLHSAALR